MNKNTDSKRDFDYSPYILVGKPGDLNQSASLLEFKKEAKLGELEKIQNWGTYREELYTGVKVIEEIEAEATPNNIELLKIGNIIQAPDVIEMGTGEFRVGYHLYEIVELPKIYGETLLFNVQSLTYRLTDLLVKRPYRSLKEVTPENMVKAISDLADCGYTNMSLNIEQPEIEQKGKINITMGSSLGSILLGKNSILYTYFGLVAYRHNRGVTMVKRRGVDRPGAYIAGTNLKTLEETANNSEVKSCIYCNADTVGGDRSTLERIVTKAKEHEAEGLELIGDTVYLNSPDADLFAFPRMRAASIRNPLFKERTAETTAEEKEELFERDYEWFRNFFCEYYTKYAGNRGEALPDYAVTMEIDDKNRLFTGDFTRNANLSVGDCVLVRSEAYGIERNVEVSAIERDMRTGAVTVAEFGSLTKGLGKWLEFENLVDDTLNERLDDLTAEDEEEGFSGNFEVNPDANFEEWFDVVSVAELKHFTFSNKFEHIEDQSAKYCKEYNYCKFYGFNPSGNFAPVHERDSELWGFGGSPSTFLKEKGYIRQGEKPEESKTFKRLKQAELKFDEEFAKFGKAETLYGGGEVRLAVYKFDEVTVGLFLLGTVVAVVKVHREGGMVSHKQAVEFLVSSCSVVLDFRTLDPLISTGQKDEGRTEIGLLSRNNFIPLLQERKELTINEKDLEAYLKFKTSTLPVLFNGKTGATLFEVKNMGIKQDQLRALIINRSKMKWLNGARALPRAGLETLKNPVSLYQGTTDRGLNWVALSVRNVVAIAKYEGLTNDQMREATDWFCGELLKRYQAPADIWNKFKRNA